MSSKALNFTIFCIGNVANYLGRDAREIYKLMQRGDIIMGYIVPCYDVLHTFSKEYIVEDLIDCMKERGLLEAA